MSGGEKIIRIDDQDPDFGYSSGWSQGGNGNEYLSTTSLTNQVGATASVQFTGTKIMIYGSIDSTNVGTSPVSLYSVDGGLATEFVEQQIDSGWQYQQKFYESDDLSPGPHQLVITISSVPSDTAWFVLDYAEYYPSSDVAATTPSPNSPSSAPMKTTTVVVQQSASSQHKTIATAQSSGSAFQSSSASQLSSVSGIRSTTLSASPTTTPSASSSFTDASPSTSSAEGANAVSRSKLSSSTPVIVSAVVGALALLILLFILFFVVKRRKARRNSGAFNDLENDDPISRLSTMVMGTPSLNTSVTPFIPDPQHHTDVFPTSTVPEYYSSTASVYGRTSSFEPSSPSSASAAGASDGRPSMSQHMPASTSYAIGAGYSKAGETRQEHEQIMEEDELEPYQPPPRYES